ncbi:MAG: NADH-quinone oxidoreductase subunit H [Candidatus Brocadiae bacterium]|nr:NADH-quinone oxidoreductase subunit H [Candidatus Brocadiia bacterium]
MNVNFFIPTLFAVVFAPLILGIINRTKAFFGGRCGQPLLQLYYDLFKLLRKGATYSKTTTYIFRLGPMVGLVCALLATTLVPFGSQRPFISFSGDILLFAYLLGLMRFFTVIAALDTGSSFEGMGAAREVHFSALAEVAFFLGLISLVKITSFASFSEIYSTSFANLWDMKSIEMILIGSSFLIVLLTENARIPVDDPNTHLELTMIHEVMVLDHSGPDFAFILYGSALKLWVLGSVFVQTFWPIRSGCVYLDVLFAFLSMIVLGVIIGIVESTMARLRLLRVPQLLVAGAALSTVALVLTMR